jgi:hypothetical protein
MPKRLTDRGERAVIDFPSKVCGIKGKAVGKTAGYCTDLQDYNPFEDSSSTAAFQPVAA